MVLSWLTREMRAPDTGADAPAGSAPPPSDPPAPAATPPPAPASAAADDADDFDKERAMATIRKLREVEKDAKVRLKRLEELEAAAQAEQAAQLSEQDRLKQELEKLKAATAAREAAEQQLAAQLRTERARNAILTMAPRMQPPLDAALAADLIKPETLEYDDDGQPTNVKAALKALSEKYPQIVARPATTTPANPTNAPRGDGTPPRESDQARRARLYGHGGGIFDSTTAKQRGGGVFFPDQTTKE